MPSYDYWEQALANPKALHAREFVITTEPQLGFFRTRTGRPVAIWEDAGEIVAAVGDDEPAPCNDDLWTRVAKYPVREQDYHDVTAGGSWPDRAAILQDTLGANIKDTTDRETLADMIALLAGAAVDYADIQDDSMAQRAMSIVNRVAELKGRADTLRKDEKEPHLEAGREVDASWMPLVKQGDLIVTTLKKCVSAYENAKMRQENALRAERHRLHQEAMAKADAFGLPPVEPTPIEPVPEAATQVRPGYGKAANIKRKLVVVRIDPLKVIRVFADNEAVITLLTKLAQGYIDNGHDVDGAETEMQAIVR